MTEFVGGDAKEVIKSSDVIRMGPDLDGILRETSEIDQSTNS